MRADTDRNLKGANGLSPTGLGGARRAVSFVLNCEEGGERSLPDGDARVGNRLVPEIVGLAPIPGRSRNVEDLFE